MSLAALVLIAYFTVAQNTYSLAASVRSALLDPLGSAAIDHLTRYWTPFQRNTQLIPLQGTLLCEPRCFGWVSEQSFWK